MNRSHESHYFLTKYVEYGGRCNVGLKGGQIANHQWAFDWHHDLWHLMTLNCTNSRSSKLHAKYFKNGDRYDDVLSGSRIWNRSWAIDCQHDLWPWMTFNRLIFKSHIFLTKYVEYGGRYNVGLEGGQIANHQWAFYWHCELPGWPWTVLVWIMGWKQHALADALSIERISCYNFSIPYYAWRHCGFVVIIKYSTKRTVLTWRGMYTHSSHSLATDLYISC